MTCSKDKTIKMWKFPDIWVDEDAVEKSFIPSEAKKYSPAPQMVLTTFLN